MVTASFAGRVGFAVQKAAATEQLSWYTPFMAAASSAVAERIPLVDFVIDVRDARIPLSSECEPLRRFSSSLHRIVVMNKVDLAERNLVKFLNFLQGQVRALRNADIERHTITMMLVGIPNVGKSALANSLHVVGRITAAEKGRLKHTVVDPLPGTTKNISSLKIASHPNIYVLDTPGILSPQIPDIEVCSKVALTGAVRDCLAGEKELAQYFLAVLNTNLEYKKWKNCGTDEKESFSSNEEDKCLHNSELVKTCKRRYPTDHTQDFVVHDIRRSLSKAISSFDGNVKDERDMLRLIQAQFEAMKEAFSLHMSCREDVEHKVALKLLNLFRIGRLGHYTLDPLPKRDWNLSV